MLPRLVYHSSPPINRLTAQRSRQVGGRSISEFITQLTGITNEDYRAGVSLAQYAQELGNLLIEHEVFVNPVTWGGGDSVFAQAQVEFHHFGRRWIDVKTWATLLSLARTQTGEVQHGGLSKAMARYKLAICAQPPKFGHFVKLH